MLRGSPAQRGALTVDGDIIDDGDGFKSSLVAQLSAGYAATQRSPETAEQECIDHVLPRAVRAVSLGLHVPAPASPTLLVGCLPSPFCPMMVSLPSPRQPELLHQQPSAQTKPGS